MINIYKYGNNIILEQINQIIDVDKLSKVINYYLVVKKELSKSDLGVSRIGKSSNYIAIGPYGSLSNEVLFEFIKSFLECSNMEYTDLRDSEIPEIGSFLLTSILPRLSIRKMDQCGGKIVDSRKIDKGVAPLCTAINSFPGITTFSSCEGHGRGNSGTLYVLFTVDSLENLHTLSKSFDKTLEIIYNKYDFKNMVEDLSLTFDFGHWPSVQKTYFEFRLRYRINKQQEIFERIKLLSQLMEEELK